MQALSYSCGTSDTPLLGITIGDMFDMTVTGKIRKVEMRNISIQELGLQSEENIQTA